MDVNLVTSILAGKCGWRSDDRLLRYKNYATLRLAAAHRRPGGTAIAMVVGQPRCAFELIMVGL
jgi:hypothetical protein